MTQTYKSSFFIQLFERLFSYYDTSDTNRKHYRLWLCKFFEFACKPNGTIPQTCLANGDEEREKKERTSHKTLSAFYIAFFSSPVSLPTQTYIPFSKHSFLPSLFMPLFSCDVVWLLDKIILHQKKKRRRISFSCYRDKICMIYLTNATFAFSKNFNINSDEANDKPNSKKNTHTDVEKIW